MLREKVSFGEGTKWGGSTGDDDLGAVPARSGGSVVRGRPRGAWTSSQWRWVPAASWLSKPLPRLDAQESRAALARRWLTAYGPATVADLKWWTGWTLSHTREALAAIGAVEVDLDGTPGFVMPDDVGVEPSSEPWVALLPALDPTVMGWKERAWYLGDHGPALFDRSGNAGPTVWLNGRIVGGWSARTGTVAFRLFEDVGADAAAEIEAEAARLDAWLGGAKVIPRFGTPLERELS